ncbi:MAG: excinuclease ABC subunit UvrC [Nitrososphaeria archaeon]|nr:excinuclease ABC subunit UvrC [Nitrososphaeria archaeon]NDB50811.1 excinuclease ABC subunit UvrC [Nitrosopumilaceae archaeon]NDB88404.1 excinuclease ABC subunit UvrC [Nitrososphaerota archaeon]NDB89569.1 excinuclease ABC subunit UvrC [Nitrososphaerota archaeon]NDB91177.1 excinuclease ABC subunit UvrC [Nitrososphaeria archaeon]
MTLDIKKISIPTHPGIYLMKDSDSKIIYIGKAKNLKNRVRSYFARNQNYKTQKLVEKIADIEFVLTDNESEAFLLESNMIKQYRPIFNIELKDQQRYTYLRITNEKYPRLLVARRTRSGKFLGDGKVYGPFTSGSSKLLSIGSLRKSFKIRICKTLPKKACLEYHLGNCEAPCEFAQAKTDYQKHVLDLESILKGKNLDMFTKNLELEMKQASDSLQFERAREIKDTLQRLGSLKTRQKMESTTGSDEEYFGVVLQDQTAQIMTFKKINGVIRDSNKYSFDLVGDNSFSNFLYQYYTTNQIPPFILVNEMPENHTLLEKMFSKTAGFAVSIITPKSGKRKEMLDLILKNIEMIQASGTEPGLMELKEKLELKTIPKIIECFDISNHGTAYAVGSMSRFVNGRPDKSGYRKFKIKTIRGQDDFAMINEIVKRRYFRLDNENAQMPDLVLIDGGKGQLGAAVSALESMAIRIPCASLAKQNEEVYLPDKKEPVIIPRQNQSLKILQFARDEAHRFGVAYNRSLRMTKGKSS